MKWWFFFRLQAISDGFRTVAFLCLKEKTLIVIFTKFRRWQQVYFFEI